MRWVHGRVDFEPAGADHHAPSSSIASGGVITREIFDETPPLSFPYSFVGMSGGSSKMSSSAGGAPIPATALDVLEPAILRWLYARRTPAQGFTIDMSPKGVQKLYDEWDQFVTRASAPDAAGFDAHLLHTCLETSLGPVRHSRRPVSFRLLASAADLTQANVEQMERLVRQHLGDDAPHGAELHEELEPRLTCAINFATRLVPPEERTTIRSSFGADAWAALDGQTRKGVQILDERLDEHWNLEELTKLVYAVPKLLMGLGEDAPPSAELKKAQRSFFAALYQLLCSSDTGPRLPTLLLSIGPEHAHRLLAEPGGN
jgi:lysyl-tRNA synthetase class 1